METNTLQALTEAIDALGDIPDEQCTDQQREAYRLCVEVLASNRRINQLTDQSNAGNDA